VGRKGIFLPIVAKTIWRPNTV